MFAVSCRVIPLSLAPAASIELSHHRRRLSPGGRLCGPTPLQAPRLAIAMWVCLKMGYTPNEITI